MKKSIIFLSIFILISNLVKAQTEPCGMEKHMEEMMKDPVFAKEWNDNQNKFKLFLENRPNNRQSSMNTVIIPVAVHFPQGNEADRDCLEDLAQSQIDVLNADWTATNDDADLWDVASVFYPGVVHGAANLTFCLATQNHPNGWDPDLIEGQPAITIGHTYGGGNYSTGGNGGQDDAWVGYFNIVVAPSLGGSTIGWSYLGGSIASGHAVLIQDNVFGTGSSCPGSSVSGTNVPYHLGRTATHEAGHFFNLPHTWANGGCGVDDGIDDTPVSDSANFGCPGAGDLPGCVAGEYDLSMNYMDYTNQDCMYMFTQGQINVSESYLSFLESQFKPNTTSNCSVSNDFTITATNSPVFSCPETGEDAVFEFEFNTYNDYNAMTVISASGTPDNATVSVSPSFINSNGTVTVTIGNLANTAQGDYTITVSATSFAGAQYAEVVLKNNCTSLQCTEFNSNENLNLAIPDGAGNNQYGDPVTTTLSVPDLGTISSIIVNVDVSHTYIQDLQIALFHPDLETYAVLWQRSCEGEDGIDVTFSDGANEIECANPTVGTFAPFEVLSIFEGMTSEGEWLLYARDGYNQDSGVINDWSIEICSELALSVDDNSNLLENISVYPNPSSGIFNVKLNSFIDSDIKISVYDILGREISQNSFNTISDFNEEIDISNAKPGIYLMTISSERGKVTRRIIIN